MNWIDRWLGRRRIRHALRKAFPRERGEALDRLGDEYGIDRRRVLWLFRESDRRYRDRINVAIACERWADQIRAKIERDSRWS